MRRALLCFVVACGTTPDVSGPITAHVTHYDYKLDLDSHAAHSKVTLVADVPGNCMSLPFRAAGGHRRIADGRQDGAAHQRPPPAGFRDPGSTAMRRPDRRPA